MYGVVPTQNIIKIKYPSEYIDALYFITPNMLSVTFNTPINVNIETIYPILALIYDVINTFRRATPRCVFFFFSILSSQSV